MVIRHEAVGDTPPNDYPEHEYPDYDYLDYDYPHYESPGYDYDPQYSPYPGCNRHYY